MPYLFRDGINRKGGAGVDINFFREFAVLARTGSYSEAAEQLFLSQPSLSKHIKSAELELGQPLFRRTTRRIELTPFGAR